MKVKTVRYILYLLIIPLILSSSYSQLGIVDITLSETITGSQVIYISDFDFLQKALEEDYTHFFDVRLSNLNQIGTNRLQLRFQLERNNQRIAEAVTNPFDISGTTPDPDVFNNIDLNYTGVSIGDANVKYDRQNFYKPTDTFQNEVLKGGKLPRAVYIFRVCLLEYPSNNVIDCDEEKIVISNPTYIKPISPGNELGMGEPEVIYDEFPVFQFDTDLMEPHTVPFPPFHVQVFKKLDYHGSIDEVLTGTPYLEDKTYYTGFNYEEIVGAQPLEPGIYAWRVNMVIQTSAGQEMTPSPVYVFEYKDVNDDSQNRVENEVVVDVGNLLRALVGNRAEVLIEKLQNYRLKEIRLNGDPISTTELYEIIDNYQGHLVEISELLLQSSQD